jgi:hypothetical protein
MTKLSGGLRGGMKPQDMTRRLDDNLSSASFEHARKTGAWPKRLKSISEKLFFIFIGLAVVFCLMRLTLQNVFPGKLHGVLEPLLGKNSAMVEQALTGTSEEDKKETDIPPAEDVDKEQEKPPQPPAKPKKKHRSHKKHGA